jgi:probable rRNA maturation factor
LSALQLEWNNDQDIIELPANIHELLEQLLNIASTVEPIPAGEIVLTFVDDEVICELNEQYRGIDKPTDVLSFSMSEQTDEEPIIVYENKPEEQLGDIVISAPAAKRQSEEYGHSLEREIGFLFIHGLLHLLGYDHQDEHAEQRMIQKQEQILQLAGLLR